MCSLQTQVPLLLLFALKRDNISHDESNTLGKDSDELTFKA
jgi:hypothetical protein